MRIKVINPNTTASMTRTIGLAARAVAAPGTEILAVNPDKGPVSIEGHYDEAVSVVGLLEVLNRSRLTSNRLFNLSPNLGAGVAFVVITIPLARFTDWLVARQARARAGG